ncbi:MAG: hypothetical protein FWC24_06295, partial [Treponema sp.]|nr:hypothetical protein [Treponema sp.]
MKKTGLLVILVFLGYILSAQSNQNNAQASIAMLNYIGTQTVIIEQSKNNRLFLEEIQSKFYNNTNPSIIDTKTQNYLKGLLDVVDGLRLVTIQKEKIQYMYENQKAQALSQAMPNPLYLLALKDKAPLDIIMTTALMAIDSVVRYNTAKSSAEANLVLANFDIRKEELVPLSNLKKDYFNHTIDITRINNLDGTESLPQESIERFVNYLLDTNKQRSREWLEQNRTLYAKYAPYWLALADIYYDLGQYQECLNSVQTYESVQAPIFRKDFDLARVLPKAVLSALNIYNNNAEFVSIANRYLQKIKDNTDESDWALRYFAAQMYISMAAVNNRLTNLQAAYDLLVENVTYLSREQDKLQNSYSGEIIMPADVMGEKKKLAERLIKQFKDERKTELPPMHSGLVLNYQTIFPLMDELGKNQAERMRVSGILAGTTVMPQFKAAYFGEPHNYTSGSFTLNRGLTGPGDVASGVASIVSRSTNWNKIEIVLPAVFLSPDSIIDIAIRGSRFYTIPAVQYKVQEVVRPRSSSVSDFTVKLELPLNDTLIIEREQEYTLQVIIKN